MEWIAASLVSALLLGCYDLSTKHAVHGNAVLPVLFFTNLCSASVWLTLMLAAQLAPDALAPPLHVVPLSAAQHGLVALKSGIVSLSWICAYFAVKHLPVSVASPIRATGPLWTLGGALLWLGERPSTLELAGILLTLASFFGLSLVGRAEGIHFHRDKWIGWLIVGTLLNAVSSLYDKYLLGHRGFEASTVQAWFSIYLALFFLPLAVGWQRRWWPRHEFHWRWSIVTMSLFLLGADFLYFNALRDPDALISIVASLRRGSTIVAFAGGILLFRELNAGKKLPALLGILAGVVLTLLGSL
jgi:drug/metabolite transporter (DMT)-like permease